MGRPKRWTWAATRDGVDEVRLHSWKYFPDFINKEMLDYTEFIWRGQRVENWKLESTLDRLIARAKIAKTKQSAFRKSHLEQFQFAARGRRGLNPPPISNENDWWALGQHHGLATPLLDWTLSPFVGAYFAFIGQGDDQGRYRALYALDRQTVERRVVELKSKELRRRSERRKELESTTGIGSMVERAILDLEIPPEVEFIRPLSDENQRLVNQGGLFTKTQDGVLLDEWVDQNCEQGKVINLLKVLIPNRDRTECLKTLNRMNINHLTLFPDLSGASKYCNLFGEIREY